MCDCNCPLNNSCRCHLNGDSFCEYLNNHPQLSGFVNLYYTLPNFLLLDTLSNTQIFIPINDALAAIQSELNDLNADDLQNNFLYSMVPITDKEKQCTLLPGYSVINTGILVNNFQIITKCSLINGNIVYTINGYLSPSNIDPECNI